MPEECAEALEEQNVACSYRDEIQVKGKGRMRVYFVRLDEDNFLVEIDEALYQSEVERERCPLRRGDALCP